MQYVFLSFFLFFFIDTAPTEIYTLSLHDALPISIIWFMRGRWAIAVLIVLLVPVSRAQMRGASRDRKSTRLNSSHLGISYAVFCLKKKKKKKEKIYK